MIMKGEKPLAWALRIDNEGELADLEALKPQEILCNKSTLHLDPDGGASQSSS